MSQKTTDEKLDEKRERMYAEMDRQIKRENDEVRDRDECLHCEGEVPGEDYENKFIAAGGVLEGPFCDSGCQWRWLHEGNLSPDEEMRKCPFKGCPWDKVFYPDEYHSVLDADAAAERHYEEEHAGEARVQVVLEKEVLIGDREPHDITDAALDNLGEHVEGYEVAFSRAEVIDEADDHSKVNHDE